jgi:MoaA/NifB/PqqE/SkfB family radical SAM enzyme
VNLTGGEPFLRDDLVDIARAVRRALPGMTVLDFPTTGQRTERILSGCAEIAALGIPRFYVTCSIEGPPDVHDRLRGRDGAFDNLMRTYRGLRALDGVAPYLGMTLSDQNAHLVDETLEAVREHVADVSLRDLHLNVYTESGHYYANRDGPLSVPTGTLPVVARALRSREGSWDPADVIEAVYLRHLPTYLRTGRSPLPCKSLRSVVFVDAEGDLYPCTVWDRKLGNVLETPLYELLDRAEAEAARRMIEADRCPGCWSPCEAHPTIVSSAPASVLSRPRSRA